MTSALKAIQQNQSDRLFYWLFFALGTIWIVYLWSQSPGTPVQDEIAHMLIAQNAWSYPELILDIWGRVVNTLIYMIPSLLGLNGARFASVIMTGITVLITTEVAYGLGVKRLYLVPLFLWFQPWSGDLAYTAITEVPFSLFLITGYYFWLKKRFVAVALTAGLLSLIRHEGIALYGICMLVMLYRREWRAMIIGSLPIIIYNLAFLLVMHVPLQDIPLGIFFQPKPTAFYGRGPWLTFVPPVVVGVGAAELIWCIYGIRPLIRLKSKADYFLIYLLLFLIHTVIIRFGLFASGGYGLFLFPLAPAFAILGAIGADHVLTNLLTAARTNSQKTKQIVGWVWAVAVIVPVLYVGLQTQPRPLTPEEVAVKEAAEWLKAYPVSKEHVVATHIWFYYFYDLPWRPEEIPSRIIQLHAMPRRTILVWDEHYSNRRGAEFNILDDPANGWTQIQTFGKDTVVIFEKTSNS